MPIIPWLTFSSAATDAPSGDTTGTPPASTATVVGWVRRSRVQVDRRFNHLYPQATGAVDSGTDYIYRIQSQNPFFIATGNGVLIASSLTELRP